MLRVLATVLLMMLCSLAAADTNSQDLPQNIRLVTGFDYPPFVDIRMEGDGLATQVAVSVLERAGLKVDKEHLPWKRSLRETRKGAFDVTLAYIETNHRDERFHYSEALMAVESTLFSRHDRHGDLSDLSRLENMTLCRPLGYAINPGLAAKIDEKAVDWVRPRSIASCFHMLERGRADLVAINRATGWYVILNELGNPEVFATREIYREKISLHLLVAHNHPQGRALIARFNKQLNAFKQTGEWQHIQSELDRYVPQSAPAD